jgi:ribonuclease P protein subunit RPR2
LSKTNRHNKPSSERRIALERISILFRLASEHAKKNPELSNRYVNLARKISMRLRVSIPTELRRRFCKHCHHYLLQGKNCRVRLSGGHVTYYCLDCRKFMRFPYLREHTAKRMS